MRRVAMVLLLLVTFAGGLSAAAPSTASADTVKLYTEGGDYQCGSGANTVKMSIDIGCKGSSCTSRNGSGCSALVDAAFAIIRFLSNGAGLVMIGSIVWAGIQYTTSRGDPAATAKAVERIRNTLIALGIFLFSYAILNWLLPTGFFQ